MELRPVAGISEALQLKALELGINVSMYNLLPRRERETALRKDIERASRIEKEENGRSGAGDTA
jgi:hypothetical protein